MIIAALDFTTLNHPCTLTAASTDGTTPCIWAPRVKDLRGRAFSFCVPALSNSLPLDVRSAPSVDTFKTTGKLKTFLFNNDF